MLIRDIPALAGLLRSETAELWGSACVEIEKAVHGWSLALQAESLSHAHEMIFNLFGHDSAHATEIEGGVRCFAPLTGNAFCNALAFETTPGAGIVLLLKRHGQADPASDQLLDIDPASERMPGSVWSAHVARYGEGTRYGIHGLEATIAAASRADYMAGKILESNALLTRSLASKERALCPVNVGLHDVDGAWQWHVLAKALLESCGLTEDLALRTRVAGEHGFNRIQSRVSSWAAAARLGETLALSCGALPGTKEREAVSKLFGHAVAGQVERTGLVELRAVRESLAASGHTSERSALDFNDMDDDCFTLDVPGWQGLALRDQNSAYAAFWQENGPATSLVVHAWDRMESERMLEPEEDLDEDEVLHPAATLDAAAIGSGRSFIGQFRIEEGRATNFVMPAYSSRAIRFWTGVLFEAGAALCAVQEHTQQQGRGL